MRRALSFLLASILYGAALFAQPYQVGNKSITYYDPDRSNRSVPTRLFYPSLTGGTDAAIVQDTFPVIVFGHGFIMANPNLYQYIWDSIVSRGYIAMFPTTEGSMFPVPQHIQFGLDLAFLNRKMKSENIDPSSFFYQRAASTSAILGHSMGGKAAFIGSKDNTDITTMITFAAANSDPPMGGTPADALRDYAPYVTVPAVVFAGEFDCVAPPEENQKLFYDTLGSVCKTYINIKGGGHCYFASSDASNCETGENSCSGSFTITRQQQNQVVLDFLIPYLDYMLKGNLSAKDIWMDSLLLSNRIFQKTKCDDVNMGIEALLEPEMNCRLSFENPVTIEVKNYGTKEVTAFYASYVFNGQTPVTELVTQNIQPNENYTHTFSSTINVGLPGTYTLYAYISIDGDADTANDSLPVQTITNTNVFLPLGVDFTSFNGTNLNTVFPGWQEAQGVTPAGTTAMWRNANNFGFSGNVNARVNIYGNTIREWILGPSFAATPYTKVSYKAAVTSYNNFNVYSAGMDNDDMVLVRVSTNCGLTWVNVDTISKTNGLTNVFTELETELGSFAGEVIRVAFFASSHVTSGNNYDFHLDDIFIYNHAPIDLAFVDLVTPDDKACFSQEEIISVRIRNNGSENIDFSVNPATVTLEITGVNPEVIETNLTGTLNTGDTLEVVVSNAYNMSLPGTYSFTGFVSIVDDGDFTNNFLMLTERSSASPEVAITASSDNICEGDSVMLSVSSSATGAGSTLVFVDNQTYTVGYTVSPLMAELPVTGLILVDAADILYVKIDSLQHQYTQDLTLEIIAPDGSSAFLVNTPRGTGNSYYNTVFTPDATQSFPSGSAPYTGNFLPQQAFSQLTGNANGTWKLKVVDDDYWDDGTLRKWSLAFRNGNEIAEYAWSTGVSGINDTLIWVKPNVTSTYSVTVSDLNGCEGIASVEINVLAPPSTPIFLDRHICQGDTVQLEASGGTQYQWAPAAMVSDENISNPFSAPDITTSYTVTISNDCGEANASFNVFVYEIPELNLVADTTLCANQSITLTPTDNADYTVEWSLSSLSGNSVNVDSLGLGLGSHTITATVIGNNNCSETGSITITFEVCAGIEGQLDIVEFVIPNPVGSYLEISPSAPTVDYYVSIYALDGKKLYTGKHKQNAKISLQEIPTGVYSLHIEYSGRIAYRKILKR